MAHKTRRSQLISPFGVGALIDSGQESFVTVDTSRWHATVCDPIRDSQLELKLGQRIRTPRDGRDTSGVPVVRFPRWLFCPSCRQLQHYTATLDERNDFKAPACGRCKQGLAPMGFVAICQDGHLQDVDWKRWAHSQTEPAKTGQCHEGALRFLTSGKNGGDWDALEVVCGCGARRDFRGLVGRELPRGLLSCHGVQPWQGQWQDCAKPLRIHRRGAGNIYYPETVSALDLLPVEGQPSTGHIVSVVRQASWFIQTQVLAKLLPGGLEANPHLIRGNAENVAHDHGWQVESVIEAILRACSEPEAQTTAPVPLDEVQDSILADEWPTLARRTPARSKLIDVQPIAVPDDWPTALRETVDGISLVRQLREVRALLGFRRGSPDAEARRVPVDLSGTSGWYPGVEVRGEGIFIWLRENAVAEWEAGVRKSLAGRLAQLAVACNKRGWNPSVMTTPRFLMLHTLAHALMRRLAFDAGYSSASLRERVYASAGSRPMAGILVYTADGDSEGSLGGLVRMGEPARLRRTLANTLRDASWCSADPVCWETEAQGIAGTNAAACHACALVSETSCVHGNALLDRRVLLRGGGFPMGFFNLDGLS